MKKRKSLPKKLQLEIYNRDYWTCQYCGDPVFYVQTLKLLEKLSPDCGYYHPNGKSEKMLKLFFNKWASIDHVKPFTKYGEDSLENLVTACWECNLRMGNKDDKQGKRKPRKIKKHQKTKSWDGLYSLYEKLR